MLTAWPALSQTDTVKLPFDIAKRVALDLVELDELRKIVAIDDLIINKYKESYSLQEQTIYNQKQQLQLLLKNIGITESQLKAEQERKPGWFREFIFLLAAGGLGFIIGSQ